MKILVIEDDDTVRTAIETLLVSADIETVLFDNCNDALNYSRSNDFDAVISDIIFFGMTGLDFLKAVKKEKPHIPVILITAYGNFDIAVEALNLGAVGFLVKPFTKVALLEKIEQVRKIIEDKRGEEMVVRYVDDLELKMTIDTKKLLQGDTLLSQSNYLARFFLCDSPGDYRGRMKYILAINEALRNGVEHGNLEVPSSLKVGDDGMGLGDKYYDMVKKRLEDPVYAGRKVEMNLKRNLERVELTIKDEGDGFDYLEEFRKEKTDGENLECCGRGLILIEAYVDEVRFNDKGNEITLIRNFPG